MLLNAKERKGLADRIKFETIWDKEYTMIHSDLDGVLSGLYLHHKYGIKIGGFFEVNSSEYNHSKIYCVERKLKNYIYLDLAITHKDCFVIDHHSQYLYGENNINCVKYTPYAELNKWNFPKKNPTGNILWMLYLLNENLDKYTYEQKLLLCIADSFHTNYHKYKDNCKRWLKYFDMECLIEVLENPSMFQDANRIIKQLHIQDQAYQTYVDGNFYNCEFSTYSDNSITTQKFMDNISKLMGWKQVQLPVFSYVHKFSNHKVKVKDVEELLRTNKRIFTSAIRSMKYGADSLMYVSEYVESEEL